MPVIPEDKLEFHFPEADSWYAFKYDEKDKGKFGFYRERIEKIDGMKGVNIVAGIGPNFPVLTLIEIKDFREDGKALREKMRTGEIPLEILQKALNTCSGLYLGARHQDPLLAADLRAAVLRPFQRIELIFFLVEAPLQPSPQERDTRQKENNRRTQRQDMLKKMREKLDPLGIRCALADLVKLPRNCGWTVTSQP
ncbi:hypothetical protein [Hymenobacter sp. PAMC 26628]|uniref:hypothetical protein n=1 Tax=Hymenobacter sp. PAMC 26628 TaxID=1484118 RepID=UPI0007706872|nr:hypothetical protein [Hymenobacter sp. PAMC 26628]AMJ66677.1 hypothetical protein AXW84_15505 [Hymenobacter sp. PAMC 26628]